MCCVDYHRHELECPAPEDDPLEGGRRLHGPRLSGLPESGPRPGHRTTRSRRSRSTRTASRSTAWSWTNGDHIGHLIRTTAEDSGTMRVKAERAKLWSSGPARPAAGS